MGLLKFGNLIFALLSLRLTLGEQEELSDGQLNIGIGSWWEKSGLENIDLWNISIELRSWKPGSLSKDECVDKGTQDWMESSAAREGSAD